MNDNMVDETEMHLWVVEATIDLPSCFTLDPNRSPALIHGSLHEGNDPDGFVEMRPLDQENANSSVLWSPSKPVAHECRLLVKAAEPEIAMERGVELFEHLADRFTLLIDYPVRVITIGSAYDEDMLKECIAGNNGEYSSTAAMGEMFVPTGLPINMHLGQLMNPPKLALEALRWFRRGMTTSRKIDQYLFFYIALESIARQLPGHVPGVTREPRRDNEGKEVKDCKGNVIPESPENAGIRYLISRYPDLEQNTKRTLSSTRARIAHGSTDPKILQLAGEKLPLLKRLLADGIALAYGLNPTSLKIHPPNPIEMVVIPINTSYSPAEDPTKRWGGLLSDAFARYLEGVSASKK